MARHPLPPVATVISFIDCINRGDLEGLTRLMSDEHRLEVLDEAPLTGREANRQAWHGYFSAFPEYVVYPWQIVATGAEVAVLGATTGSHLGLTDDVEKGIAVIWVAEVRAGLVDCWRIVDATPANRARYGFASRAVDAEGG